MGLEEAGVHHGVQVGKPLPDLDGQVPEDEHLGEAQVPDHVPAHRPRLGVFPTDVVGDEESRVVDEADVLGGKK